MAQTEAQKRADKKWKDANVKRYSLQVRNELHERIETHLQKTGATRSGFIIQAIKEKLDREEL